MPTLVDEAVEALRRMPEQEQTALARFVLDLAHRDSPEPIPPEHLDAVLEGCAEADRGEFASDEEVEAAFRLFRP